MIIGLVGSLLEYFTGCLRVSSVATLRGTARFAALTLKMKHLHR